MKDEKGKWFGFMFAACSAVNKFHTSAVGYDATVPAFQRCRRNVRIDGAPRGFPRFLTVAFI
jgi:hypothetical protein